MPYASHNPEGSTVLLILGVRRLRLKKVQGLLLSPWLGGGRARIPTLAVCLQGPSLPYYTMVYLWGVGHGEGTYSLAFLPSNARELPRNQSVTGWRRISWPTQPSDTHQRYGRIQVQDVHSLRGL